MTQPYLPQLNLPLRTITLSSLDLKDKSFCLSYGHTLTPLKESIKRVGLLTPPLIKKKSSTTYHIVCGYRRVLALKALGVPSAPCRVVPPQLTARECLLMSLYDNLSHREFNLIEKSLAVNKLKDYYDEGTIIRQFLPRLKLHPHRSQLNLIAPLSRLPATIKEALLEGTISEHTAFSLTRLNRNDKNALALLLTTLRLSVSSQAEVTEHSLDIAQRDGIPIAKVVTSPEICSILANKRLNQPQKAEAVRRHLRERRYPRLTEREKRFTSARAQLKLHPDLQLIPPPSFEGPHYLLKLRFKDRDSLQQRIGELNSILNHPALISILENE